jgi:predicted Zn-dependent protease
LLGDVTAVQSVLLANGPQFLALSHGRGLEEEADREGARLLLKADVDPKGLPDFFRIMQKEEGAGAYIPEFMSSHPETAGRIEAIEAFISAQPEADGSYQGFDLDWTAMKKSLAEAKP